MYSIQQIEETSFPRTTDVEVRPGDKVRVHVRIVEIVGGGRRITAEKVQEKVKTRTQVFEGTVIGIHRAAHRSTFTVRKISYGVGVERIFPFESPNVERIELVSRHRVRRAKLYFLRGRRGKAARLQEIR